MDQVLLIEDDYEISHLLELYLTSTQKYQVTVAHSAEAALSFLSKQSCDCILLDIMLPRMDGISFCRQIRRQIYCPIIFISCLDDDETIVKAMNMGGDAYLIKPFNKSVLLAYIEANIRRSRLHHPQNQTLQIRDLQLDPVTRHVAKRGQELLLSPTEYELLYYMMRHRGEFLAFEDIYVAVWGESSYGTVRTLFTHVLNLRKKIEDDVKNPYYISTFQRSGYIFAAK